MTISVFPPGRGLVSSFGTTFALQQDNWNDYSFQTLYHLYRNETEQGQGPTLIGSVKILRRGQTASDGIQIKEPFQHLNESFCSVGFSLDYYQRLNAISSGERDEILQALRDVVANPSLQDSFREEKGWLTSLFRDNPDPDEFLRDARAILTNNFHALQDLRLKFSFHPTNWTQPLEIEFDAPEPFFYAGPYRYVGPNRKATLLPRRVVALIGRNGCGKSTLLARIARVAFAAPSDRVRPELQSIGSFEPSSVGFTKIIAVSYSAFDNFMVPGLDEGELRQIAIDMEKGGGRYVYAGLRDIVAEVRDDLAALQERFNSSNERVIVSFKDRRTSTRLKSLDQLAEEFTTLIHQVAAKGDSELLQAALEPLFNDPSFSDGDGSELESLLGPDPRNAFLGWSTGHKIALHVIASLVGHAERKSLVLFDEPEMHLHPPLTAALMHAVRVVLEEKDAFAIVATHSPVILQETLSKHVRIIRRAGDEFSVLKPVKETFGENVGTLTYDAFGLTAASTDYHQLLDLLINSFSSLDEISALFSPSLSGQALAYVMAGLARKSASR